MCGFARVVKPGVLLGSGLMPRRAQLLLPAFGCCEFVVRDRGGEAVPVEQLCGKDEVILVPAALFSGS